MNVALISHPSCLLHEVETPIPEVSRRLVVIQEALQQTGLMQSLISYDAPIATREQLLRVHAEHYVNYVFQHAPQESFFELDPDTSLSPHTLTAALHAAGAGILAVELILAAQIQRAFCNVRPPGHHAEREQAMGFCIFNNVAIAVAHALTHPTIEKVAIIDFDAHHGNGIEDIFRNDPRVLYCSSFEYPFYPFSGADTESDHIINLPLDAGTDGKLFRKKVLAHWIPAITEFKPNMLFFSAGFDAFYQDRMSNLLLHESDYAWITRSMVDLANVYCEGRVVSILEGGYDLAGLGNCAAAHINELVIR